MLQNVQQIIQVIHMNLAASGFMLVNQACLALVFVCALANITFVHHIMRLYLFHRLG